MKINTVVAQDNTMIELIELVERLPQEDQLTLLFISQKLAAQRGDFEAWGRDRLLEEGE